MLDKIQDSAILKIANSLKIDDVFFLFATEIEFFVLDDEILTLKSDKIQKFYQDLQNFAQKNNIIIENIEKEDGINQFEIQLQPNDLASELSDQIVLIKNEIARLLTVDFRAKPFIDRPGNSMHFHISLYDENEQNLFMKLDQDYQNNLYYAVGGLLKNMPSSMPIFAPTQNCYERYKIDKTKHIQYPTNYSWGINNRTCAIRIPQSITVNPQNTRIEHRVCSGIADPHSSLSAIIDGICEGIINKIMPPDPIFGNSFDAQYNIKNILL